MCGIHGFTFSEPELANKMIAAARHRGPDGEGTYTDGRVTLAHNLLAITEEAEKARQPWRSNDGRYVLCYNGEIYNYRQLRVFLRKGGNHFKTDSDTEVLFHGLRSKGIKFLNNIDGMYGFAWYDSQTGQLLLARDPAGMKPLYYQFDRRGFCFSSELQSLLLNNSCSRRLDPLALSIYFSLGYLPGQKTLIQGISKFAPGEWIKFDIRSQRITDRGSLIRDVPEPDLTKMDAADYQSALSQSVKRCLSGQRSIGLNLSGGMDSASILHEMTGLGFKVRTFTTRFTGNTNMEKYNEDADIARGLSQHYGSEHQEIEIAPTDFAEALESTVEALGHPHGNKNLPAYYLHLKAVAKAGVVVLLGGEGGDEILSGYGRHRVLGSLQQVFGRDAAGTIDFTNARQNMGLRQYANILLNRDPGHPSLVRMRRRLGSKTFRGYFAKGARISPITYWFLSTRLPKCDNLFRDKQLVCNEKEKFDYFHDWISPMRFSTDALNNQLRLDGLNWLAEEALIRNDKLGMAFGMESRFPFLADAIRTYCFRLPASTKMTEKKSKIIPRQAYKGILPETVLDRKKTGWSAPSTEWCHTAPLKDQLQGILSPDYYAGTKAEFNFNSIPLTTHPTLLFTLANFQIWARQNHITI